MCSIKYSKSNFPQLTMKAEIQQIESSEMVIHQFARISWCKIMLFLRCWAVESMIMIMIFSWVLTVDLVGNGCVLACAAMACIWLHSKCGVCNTLGFLLHLHKCMSCAILGWFAERHTYHHQVCSCWALRWVCT